MWTDSGKAALAQIESVALFTDATDARVDVDADVRGGGIQVRGGENMNFICEGAEGMLREAPLESAIGALN